MSICRFFTGLTILIGRIGFVAAADPESVDKTKLPAAANREVSFASEIHPLLAKACFSCHGPEKQEAGLRLDVRTLALTGSDSGRVIVPKNGAESRLLHLIANLDGKTGRMPPEGEGEPLSNEQIAIVRAWIDAGAPWPDELAGNTDGKASKHWSFQAISRPPLPAVRDAKWVRNPVDAFVLTKLERERIRPSPEANRTTLLRRVYLDLIGLLPSVKQIDAFLVDTRPDAYERSVDELLESPHYGERWGRHWLDVARYADTDGYEQDFGRPFAWRYRDWVITATNRDLPFDIFTVQQLAGDLLQADDREYDAAARIATGFLRNTLINKEAGVDPEEDRVKRTLDRTNTVGTAWLGLTIGCANCHTHKYDPISQREYFGLYAFFNSIEEVDVPVAADAPQELAQAVCEADKKRATHIHVRGDFLTNGPAVEPHTLQILPNLATQNDKPNRLDLARWIVDPTNPLMARVIVNRLWQGHFGRGLVATPDDFGTQGELPSHPELLDWLASEFRESGWRLKPLHRLIVTSSTYRQSAVVRPELTDRDPYNTWLSRQNRVRAEAEIVRDLALSASGLLHHQVGGASVRPPQPPGIAELTYADKAKWVESEGTDRYRRGLYIWFQRTSPYPSLTTFDAPDANLTCVRRERSNTPLQALTLLNDTVFVECAQALGRRMLAVAAVDENDTSRRIDLRIGWAVRTCLGREALPHELALLRAHYDYLLQQATADSSLANALIGPNVPENAKRAELAACVVVARAILNLDEFITRE